jgi:hypothetical protein
MAARRFDEVTLTGSRIIAPISFWVTESGVPSSSIQKQRAAIEAAR